MNKEKLLSKIGNLIDKGGLTEDDLAIFFQDDEKAVAPEEPEQSEGEKAVTAEPEGEESEREEAEKPVEETPEEPKEEERKPEETAVPEEAPKEEAKPVEAPEWEGKFNELASKIEGLSKENESLREALRKAKVLEDVNQDRQVGYGTSASPNLGREGSDLSDTLAKLNRGRN